jgi:ssRNA-specific RNase YbeY (16S rRNA maturation enzyme)
MIAENMSAIRISYFLISTEKVFIDSPPCPSDTATDTISFPIKAAGTSHFTDPELASTVICCGPFLSV